MRFVKAPKKTKAHIEGGDETWVVYSTEELRITNTPIATLLTIGTVVFVIGLVAYRLLWSAPLIARLGVLPKNWQRWIFGEYK